MTPEMSPFNAPGFQLTEDADWDAIAAWCGGQVVRDKHGERCIAIPGYPTLTRSGSWIVQGALGGFLGISDTYRGVTSQR